MLAVEYTTKFKKDLKLARKRNKDLEALRKIMKKIENEEEMVARDRIELSTQGFSVTQFQNKQLIL